MADAPERIWIDKLHGKHPDDWTFNTAEFVKDLPKRCIKQKVEYVRADLHEAVLAEVARLKQANRALRSGNDLLLRTALREGGE